MSAELSIVVKIGAAVGGTMAAFRSLLRGSGDLQRSTSLLQREYDVLGRAIRRATQSGGSDLQRLQRQQDRVGDSLRRLNTTQNMRQSVRTRLDNGREYREQLRSEAMGAFAGMGTVLVPIKMAMDFESAMADVRKVVDFDTPQQFKEMEQQLLSMTHKIPMASTELAKIAASGGQLGIARQDIAQFTETIAKMSVAFDMTAEQAGDSMAKLANVYKIPIKQINVLGDAINHLSNSSPAKASDIVNTLGRVGGVAKQFGLTELQTASLSNALISLGKTPEVAGTAINGMLTKLMTAEKGGKDFQAALKSMGISAKQLKKDIAQNGEQALMDFLKAINKLPKDQQMGTLVDLFGLEYADDVAVLSGSLETYQKSIDALKSKGKDGKPSFSGSMDKEFAARSATTANNLQLFKNQMAHLGINIGSVMLPAVNALLNEMKPLVDSFIRFAEAHPNLIKNIFLGIAALAAFKVGSLAVRLGLSLLGSLFFGTAGRMLSFAGSLLRVRGALQLLSVGRSVMALRLLGLSAVQARTILAGLGRVGAWVSAGFRLIGSAFSGVVRVGGMLIRFLPMVGQAFMALGRFLLMTPIGLALGLLATAGYLLYTRWSGVVGGAKLLWQSLSNTVGAVARSISQFFQAAWTSIKALFSQGIGFISSAIMGFSPLGLFRAVFAPVIGWFAGLPSQFAGFGRNLMQGLLNGIQAGANAVLGRIQSLASNIKSKFQSMMGIHSPSRVFGKFGGWLMEGLNIGISRKENQPISRMGQLADNLKQRFTNGAGSLKTNVSGVWGNVKADFAEKLGKSTQAIQQARQHTQAQNGAITVHFNPTININGGGNVSAQMQQGLQMSLHEFEKMLDRVVAEKMRRAY